MPFWKQNMCIFSKLNNFAAVLQESIQVCLINIQEKIDKDEKIDEEDLREARGSRERD